MQYLLLILLSITTAAIAEITRYTNVSEAKQNSASQSDAKPVFVQVPPSESKITWVHDNGRSEARQLPETCGGGGLFFDFDNDGWMDIYLVNSGASDLFRRRLQLETRCTQQS